MIDFFFTDILGFALYGSIMLFMWRSNTTAASAVFILPCSLIIITHANQPVVWHDFPIIPGQFYLAFSCVGLAVVHARLGPLAAHRVWRLCCASLVMTFLLTSRFLAVEDQPGYDLAEHYNGVVRANLRLWGSLMFVSIFIGGIGQVIWKVTEWEGGKRYTTTIVGLPAASVIHSFIAFYEPGVDPLFMERVFWSALLSTYAGTVMLAMLWLIIRFWDDGEAGRVRLIKASTTELLNDGSYHRGVQGQRRQHKRHRS